MKLAELPALDLYVWGALDESSPISLKDYSALDLDVPEGQELLAKEANEELIRVKQPDESYYDLGYNDDSICCRCPKSYEFSEWFF